MFSLTRVRKRCVVGAYCAHTYDTDNIYHSSKAWYLRSSGPPEHYHLIPYSTKAVQCLSLTVPSESTMVCTLSHGTSHGLGLLSSRARLSRLRFVIASSFCIHTFQYKQSSFGSYECFSLLHTHIAVHTIGLWKLDRGSRRYPRKRGLHLCRFCCLSIALAFIAYSASSSANAAWSQT